MNPDPSPQHVEAFAAVPPITEPELEDIQRAPHDLTCIVLPPPARAEAMARRLT